MSREPIRIHHSFQTLKMPPKLLWGISRRFHRLSPWYGKVAHALRTLPPVAIRTSTNLRPMLPLDLHVLSLPLAFILSQDQTLLCIFFISQLEPDTLNSKRINALDFLFLGTCLYLSYQSFQWSFIVAPRGFSEADCKGRHYFLFRKNILKKF